MKVEPAIRIKSISKALVLLIRLVDLIQGTILKNYAVFSFVVGHAPQRLGADACYYRAFKEFLIARRRVRAYRDFLRKRGWSCGSSDPKEIFRSLPLMDKPGYILAYSTEERCLDGSFFSKGVVVDESSGATGIPYNWVRSEAEREIVKNIIGVYLRYCYGDANFIVLNMFSMGAWATGFALAAQSLGVVKSTGPDVDKILHTLEFLGNRPVYPQRLSALFEVSLR